MKKTFLIFIFSIFFSLACFAEDLSLGVIQQNIYDGMFQAEVLSALGSPNMITKESDGRQTWIYNKHSKFTKESYNKSWLWLLFFGRRKGSQNTESGQKTLTLILNFDKNSCLESYTYKEINF